MQRIVCAQGKKPSKYTEKLHPHHCKSMSPGFNIQLFFWDSLSKIPLLLKIDSSQCPHYTVWTTNIRLSFVCNWKSFMQSHSLDCNNCVIHLISFLLLRFHIFPDKTKMKAAELKTKKQEETPNVAKSKPANPGWDSHLPSVRTGRYSSRDFFPPCFSKDF